MQFGYLLTMNTLFCSQNSYHDFVQMDKLIEYVNSNSSLNVSVQYAFMSDYVKVLIFFFLLNKQWNPCCNLRAELICEILTKLIAQE